MVIPVLVSLLLSIAQDPTVSAPVEEDYYRAQVIPLPEDVVLEVGGIALLPDQRLIVCTRRGELYVARALHGRLDVLDAGSLETKRTIPLTFGIRELMCNEADGLVIALDWFKGSAWVIDVEGPRLLVELRSADAARAITYDEGTKMVYIGTREGIFRYDITRFLETTLSSRGARLEEAQVSFGSINTSRKISFPTL